MSNQSQLPCSTPESQGISSSAILAFIESVEQSELELHSFMLLRHGHIVSEGWWAPYGPQRPHMLYSLSKSFTSTAIGLAVAEGKLTVDDSVLSFFPDEITEEPGDNLRSMRVRDLLSMSTGHAEDTTGRMQANQAGNWVEGFLKLPVEHAPGTHFVYNSGATYMLSAIIQQVTGLTLLDYLQPRLLAPLGIEGATWESCPRGIHTGGWGLSVKTEDIAAFGQLYLQKGTWNDQRLLSEAWVEEATEIQISNGDGGASDWSQGYGYQFWRCRHGAYRGDGAFGQYCIVMPEQDAVIAITSGLNNMQAVLDLIWEHLLPAMGSEVLPNQETEQATLQDKLASLVLAPDRMQSSSPMVAEISGKPYQLEDNEAAWENVSFTFAEDACVFSVRDRHGEHRIRCGLGEWIEGDTSLTDRPPVIVASGTWRSDDTFVMTWRFVETPYYETVTCQWIDKELRLESGLNVAFGTKERPALLGRTV